MSSIYKPIPGVGRGRGSLQLATRSQLYAAPDHLLVVTSTGYTEEYRRVFYRDIRSIDIRQNQVRFWIGFVTGIIIAFFGLMAVLFQPTVFIVLGSPFALWFLINLALGPSVYCYVTTNVQALKLPAPRRRYKVARFVAFLRERAVAAQAPAAVPA